MSLLRPGEVPALELARLALHGYRIAAGRGRLVGEGCRPLLAALDPQGEANLLAGRSQDTT